MSYENRTMQVAHVALTMLPVMRDRFDFTDPEHYNRMVDMAWLAGEAFIKKQEAMFIAARAKDAPPVKKEETK